MIREDRRRRAQKKKILIGILALFGALAAAVLIVTQVFTVKKVEVSGNEWYSDEQIKESVLSDEYAWNSLYVVLKYKLFHTKQVPFVDEMEISLVSPHTLKIRVYEKAIIGFLEANSQNVYFDKDGFVVEISKKQIAGVPKVEGIACHKVVVYEKLNIDDNEKLALILTFSQQLEKYDLAPESIICADKTLSASFGDLTVQIGDAGYLVEKVMRLNNILPQLAGKKGTLHLENWTPMTTDIVFTPVKQEKQPKKKKG